MSLYNTNANGETAIFSELSGTGKTTLLPILREHSLVMTNMMGITDGIFNLRERAINLSKEAEPDIYKAIKSRCSFGECNSRQWKNRFNERALPKTLVSLILYITSTILLNLSLKHRLLKRLYSFQQMHSVFFLLSLFLLLNRQNTISFQGLQQNWQEQNVA